METLLLSESDLQKILDEKKAIEAVEQAFLLHGRGEVEMPPKIYLNLAAHGGDFRAMPSHISKLNACGMKWVNAHPKNLERGSLPAVMGIFILNDPGTGFPLAIMDGTLLTRLRTGAAGAVASKYLADPKSQVLALVGCGIQARAQLDCHQAVFKLNRIHVCGKTLEDAKNFEKKLRDQGVAKIFIFKTIEECVRDADIICTTTPSRHPILMSEWLKPGVHINAMGADGPGKQELDPAILKKSFLVVDDIEQAIHGGELNVPFSRGLIQMDDIDATLGEIVSGKKIFSRKGVRCTVFDSTGLAIQDLALAQRAYVKAKELKIGRLWSLFDVQK